jgi:hypothetical protein
MKKGNSGRRIDSRPLHPLDEDHAGRQAQQGVTRYMTASGCSFDYLSRSFRAFWRNGVCLLLDGARADSARGLQVADS